MSNTNWSLPAIFDPTAAVGRTYDVAVVGTGTMNVVQANLAVGAGGSGASLVFRVGTNLDGVEDVDYVELDFLSSFVVFKSTSISFSPFVGQNLKFRIESEGGSTQLPNGFTGNVTIDVPVYTFVSGPFYSSVEDVKEYLALKESNEEYDVRIEQIIAGVSRSFDGYTGVSFTPEAVEEYRDGSGFTGPIILNGNPSEVQATRDSATLEENGVALTQGVDWYMDPYPSRAVYRLNDGEQGAFHFAAGTRNLKFDYLTRYEAVPADVNVSATEESARRFKALNTVTAAGDDRLGIVSRGSEVGATLSYAPDDFSATTLRTLDGYRDRRFV